MNNNKITFSIVIPYYNNESIITECLPSIIDIKEKHAEITEILCINDCSTDSTSLVLSKYVPSISVIDNTVNMGFGKTCNKGISIAENEWVLLLNSDISFSTDPIPSLIKAIKDTKDLFQIAFYSFQENGERFEGQKFIKGKTGLYKTRNNFSEYDMNSIYDSLYACGGHCLISKSKFEELGGFSPIYEPFYWEDADLSYRGLKRGWRVLFAPQCQVIHKHRGSIRSSNSQRKIDIIQTRNKILFFWANISSRQLWLYHLSGMFFRTLTSWISGDFVFYSALVASIKRLKLLYIQRDQNKPFWRKNDIELFKIGRHK